MKRQSTVDGWRERQFFSPLSLSFPRFRSISMSSFNEAVCVCHDCVISLSSPQLIDERKSPTKSTPLSFSFFHLSHSYLTSYTHVLHINTVHQTMYNIIFPNYTPLGIFPAVRTHRPEHLIYFFHCNVRTAQLFQESDSVSSLFGFISREMHV